MILTASIKFIKLLLEFCQSIFYHSVGLANIILIKDLEMRVEKISEFIIMIIIVITLGSWQ